MKRPFVLAKGKRFQLIYCPIVGEKGVFCGKLKK
jgi:hypothetical protein